MFERTTRARGPGVAKLRTDLIASDEMEYSQGKVSIIDVRRLFGMKKIQEENVLNDC